MIDKVELGVGPAPPPPPEMGELIETIPTTAYHKIFMSTKPPNFSSREGSDRADKWLKEIEKAFNIVEVPNRLKV